MSALEEMQLNLANWDTPMRPSSHMSFRRAGQPEIDSGTRLQVFALAVQGGTALSELPVQTDANDVG
jgi:hypothetical protein